MEGEKELDMIWNRWRGRAEWRFFKKVFDDMKGAPIERRLELASELDYYYYTGKLPEEILAEEQQLEKLGNHPNNFSN